MSNVTTNDLLDEIDNLKQENEKLQNELDDLRHEYSENTIVQSMNDMKDRYEELVSTTVSLYKYENLKKKHTAVYRTVLGITILNNHIKKIVEELETRFTYERYNMLTRIKSDIITINEIIEDVLEKNDKTF
jgi:nucleotidyltransferase/DNA polymerase involved in DNA repair